MLGAAGGAPVLLRDIRERLRTRKKGLPLRQARSIAVCLAVVFVGLACRKATPRRLARA
ncbi:hypothetical protein LCGC14_1937060, partial [marine sediment metagenome]